ncbi:MAG TPA: hypothetical protein VNI01_02655, partial [Elusimicrobiota bacterium]|nr:hypothetical protein [Elusimicrobiota bacterium]
TRSCGIAAERHVAVPPEVWRALAERAVGRAPHVPQLVSRPLLAWADVVLTMTAQQREVLLDSYAEHHRKIFLLRERAGLEGDVADPIGKEWPDYRACARSIAEALERILSPG